jgi:hypothetical protein
MKAPRVLEHGKVATTAEVSFAALLKRLREASGPPTLEPGEALFFRVPNAQLLTQLALS